MGAVLVEGGPSLLTSLINRELIDGFHVFVTPGFIGGQSGRIGRKADGNHTGLCLKDMKRFQLMSSHQFKQDVLLEFITKAAAQLYFQ